MTKVGQHNWDTSLGPEPDHWRWMHTNVEVREDFPKIIDSTMLADFRSCEHKFFRAHMQSLRLMRTNVHLHFGGCIAKALEVFRKAYYTPSSPTFRQLEPSFSAGAHALAQAWGDYEPEIETPKTFEGAVDCYLSFFEQYPPDREQIVPLLIGGKPAVEINFALPLPGTYHPTTNEPILYAGRLDMLATYTSAPGLIFVNDEKTTTQLGKTWANNWRLKSQLTAYVWAASHYVPHVSGVIVRGFSILKRDIGHALVIQQRPQWMIDRWLYQTALDIERMIKCWNDGYWGFNLDSACSEYGGCPYLDLCESEQPEAWEQNYHRYEWDPLRSTTEDS
jgi:hypothetical protein